MYKGTTTKQDATINAYDVSGPIPISRGTNKLTLTYLEKPWNHTVDDEGKKRQDSHWYSLAGMLQWGQVNKITKIWNNGKRVNEDNITLDSDSVYYFHDWGDLGMRFRVHRGSMTQTADPRLTGSYGGVLRNAGIRFVMNAAPNTHGSYRGLCYVVFDTYCTGWSADETPGGTHVPDIQFNTYTLNDVINPGGETERYGVNPIGFIYDILKAQTYGMGLSEERVPLADWTNAALDFYHERGTSDYISPLIDSKNDVTNSVQGLLDYYHGYIPRKSRSLIPTWLKMDTVLDTSTLPVISSNDFTEFPTVTDNDMSKTFTSIELKCKDYDDDLGDASLMIRSPFGYFLTPESKTTSKTLSHIHDVNQALAWGNREIKLFTRPTATIEGYVPREVARNADGSPISIGDTCLYVDDLAESQYVCMVSEKKDSLDKGVSLKLTEIPGQWPQQEESTTDEREDPPDSLPEDIEYIRAWALPSDLQLGTSQEMTVLIEQPDYCTYAEIYISEQSLFEGEEAQLDDDLTYFASRGSLSSSISDTDTTVEFAFGSAVLSRSFTNAEVADRHTFILVGDEVMALKTLVDATETTVTYTVERHVFWTTAVSHNASSEVWIIERSKIQRYTSSLFAESPSISWVKAIPVGLYGSGNPSDAVILTTGDVVVLSYGEDQIITENGYTINPTT